MSNDKKNSFFSWLTNKISNNKISTKKVLKTDKEYKEGNCLNKKSIPNILAQEKNIQKKFLKTSTSLKTNNDDKIIDIDIIQDIKKNTQDNITKRNNIFLKLKNTLRKTQKIFSEGISNIFTSKKMDKLLFKTLEEKMLLADIGIDTTDYIINTLITESSRKDLQNSEQVYYFLQKKMYYILKKVDVPLKINNHIPFIILVVGVNGVGKTTTAVKLAKKYKSENKSVMLVAADTFRAAGVEQLKQLGEINNIPVISHQSGTDSSAVIFDAVQAAISRNIDILIIDTAGRLHNKLYLMEELKKNIRVIKKINSSAPHEIMLVIDASNGQNTLKQTENFHNALNITGIVITKLDGTAKGGVLFSIAHRFSIPIRYIGIGENITDLEVFNSKNFIKIIFDQK
ncbi:signal recognition particle-docking protein FtsY [Buchnera aphidicola]|uniref:signal recognition particle-docking protein FtsY n=1 Tax=Buchnera aphidicola TaxID=9 RepID=UPI0034641A00